MRSRRDHVFPVDYSRVLADINTKVANCLNTKMVASLTVLLNKANFPFTEDKWEDAKLRHRDVQFMYDESKTSDEFLANIKKFQDVEVIAGVKNFYNLDGKVFDLLPKLKAVCFSSAGYNQIDFKEATRRGIQISRVYDLDTSTADTNLFLLLGAMRFFQYGIKDLLVNRKFRDPPQVGVAPDGKVLGIVGLGAIGRQVAARAKPLGFEKILYFGRHQQSKEVEAELGVEYVGDIDELVKQSDVIDLNCALTKETFHLINEERILKMKDGVIIVNTARGDIIDETALIKYLKNGKILAAGLDVFHNEPNINYELVDLENVISLPHLGSYTKATRIKAQLTVLRNVENYIANKKLLTYIGEQKDIKW